MSGSPPPSWSRPGAWLAIFGPGAIIASLTIGSGELVFSSRGGALFGYPLLGTFLAVCILKWALVFTTARHLVLTGCHPFERWATLPGPRGWLPAVFFLFALLCFPVWVAFHAATVGTLVAGITQTSSFLAGTAATLWAVPILIAVTWLTLTGSYQRLEKLQIGLVTLMLLLVLISLILLGPDWSALFRGFLSPPPSAYPSWLAARYPEIADRPLWLELSTYVGVIGGSGYDYLAYVSFLRHKAWGRSQGPPAEEDELRTMAAQPRHPDRSWVRAPLIDCSLSFLVVLIFSAVFVACGSEVLRTQQSVPSGATLLTLQTRFGEHLGPWFEPFYLAGALLAMGGTLYGTLEVAPAIWREGWRALHPPGPEHRSPTDPGASPDPWRRPALLVTGCGGLAVLAGLWIFQLQASQGQPGLLVALLTPANLFTGVLACGLISWLSLWADYRFLPAPLRMPWPCRVILFVGGALFLLLGLKAYADLGAFRAALVFTGTLIAGIAVAHLSASRIPPRPDDQPDTL